LPGGAARISSAQSRILAGFAAFVRVRDRSSVGLLSWHSECTGASALFVALKLRLFWAYRDRVLP
jgi:hypothetical protein